MKTAESSQELTAVLGQLDRLGLTMQGAKVASDGALNLGVKATQLVTKMRQGQDIGCISGATASCASPTPPKTATDLVESLTTRQLSAILGLKNDPLTGEEISPNEILDARVLGLPSLFMPIIKGGTATAALTTKLGKDAVDQIESVANMATDANKVNSQLAKDSQLIGDQPYIAPTHTSTGSFQTHGVTVDQVPETIRNQMLSDLQAGGATNPQETLTQIAESGKTVPVPIKVTPNTKLYKLVPTDGAYPTPSPSTPYWVDQTQLDLIKAHPDQANNILGLPANSQSNSFNVFEIQPKSNTTPTIYQSQVATTTNNSDLTNVGNATQTIVPNRSLWTTPQPTGTVIKVN